MTTPDFSKIWAANTPLTPYEFSDEDYLDGWEFLGEIPPDRRMFDTLQKQNDTKLQWLYSNAANWLRKNSTQYEVGDIAFSTSLPSYLVLKCIEAGTTAATEPSFSGAAVGGTVTDGTVVWQYYDLLSGSGVPLGSILPYSGTGDTPPYGFLFFEGQAVSRTMYADYFDLVGTTYGEGDGENTFNLPNLIEAAMLNGSYTKTSYETAGSATFTAPKTGWYRITAKGGGGGGQGANLVSTNYYEGGGAGGEGGTTIAYEKMIAGDIASVVIGSGGTGGAAGGIAGTNGGNSTVTVNLNTYTGGGGKGGITAGAAGGSGTIQGASGGGYTVVTGISAVGSVGAGAGGSTPSVSAQPAPAVNGGGGAGGSRTSASYAGGNGGDGYVTFEYIGVSMKYIGKVYDAPTPSSAQIDLSQYAIDLARRLTREQTPAFNRRDVITTSGTYTTPVTGWYRITAKGGGGGGNGAITNGESGGGGGEGGTTIGYEKMTAGDTASVVIGAGGAGGTTTSPGLGSSGGTTSVTVNNHTYSATGGQSTNVSRFGAQGGTGTINGAGGGSGGIVTNATVPGGTGGGAGGGLSIYNASATDGTDGGGGGGGTATASTLFAGGNGGDGFVWFEYFDGSLN